MEKLIELIDKHRIPNYESVALHELSDDAKDLIFQELFKLPQFKNTKRFVCVKLPIGYIGDKVYSALSAKLMSNEEYKEREMNRFIGENNTLMFDEIVYIYALTLSLPIYNEPTNTDMMVSPGGFSPFDFEFSKTIKLITNYNPSGQIIDESEYQKMYKANLHKKLDEAIEMILENKTNYTSTNFVMMRFMDVKN